MEFLSVWKVEMKKRISNFKSSNEILTGVIWLSKLIEMSGIRPLFIGENDAMLKRVNWIENE